MDFYKQSCEYAKTHGEEEAYYKSRQENLECKKTIEMYIREKFNGYTLDEQAVVETANKHGIERTAYVLANTIVTIKSGRISLNNRAWAEWRYDLPEDKTNGYNLRLDYLLNVPAVVLDKFTSVFCRIYFYA